MTERCDIHVHVRVPAVYDGKTRLGPWAFMCEECFRAHGIPVKGLYTRLPSSNEDGPSAGAILAQTEKEHDNAEGNHQVR